jgi:hypothetical protein
MAASAASTCCWLIGRLGLVARATQIPLQKGRSCTTKHTLERPLLPFAAENPVTGSAFFGGPEGIHSQVRQICPVWVSNATSTPVRVSTNLSNPGRGAKRTLGCSCGAVFFFWSAEKVSQPWKSKENANGAAIFIYAIIPERRMFWRRYQNRSWVTPTAPRSTRPTSNARISGFGCRCAG